MQIGTVKEVKPREYRVALTPSCVKAYTDRGHEVMVEKGADSLGVDYGALESVLP